MPASRRSLHRPARRLTAAGAEALDEIVAEEVAVALVYNGVSHAVMMATPCDLEDFARGFSLTEHIVEKPSEIYDIEVEAVEGPRLRGAARYRQPAHGLAATRRRSMSGRTGCGLCGVDSLEAALRPVPAAPARVGSRARRSSGRWRPAGPAEDQPRKRRHARRRLGHARRHAGRGARGCRPSQRARQAGRGTCQGWNSQRAALSW